MRKRIIALLSTIVISFSLIGCGPGDYDGKIVNKSIITGAKVTGLERPPYRGSVMKVHTDKGEFMMYTSHAEYFEQLEDFYKMKQDTKKDLIINIMYINNKKINDEMFEIKDISIAE